MINEASNELGAFTAVSPSTEEPTVVSGNQLCLSSSGGQRKHLLLVGAQIDI